MTASQLRWHGVPEGEAGEMGISPKFKVGDRPLFNGSPVPVGSVQDDGQGGFNYWISTPILGQFPVDESALVGKARQ